MKAIIDYSSLGKSSPISKFIQKSSNEILLDTLCLGYKQRQSMELSEISNIITNTLSQHHLISEKNTRKNIMEQQNNINSQLSNIKESSSYQLDLVKSEIDNIKQQILLLPKEINDKGTSTALRDIINKLDKLQNPHSEFTIRMNSLEKMLENQYNGIMTKKIDELKENIFSYGKQQNSQQKGLQGEELVRKRLLDFFPDANIEDVRSEGYKGDFIFSRVHKNYNIEILIEVKNYGNKNVPTKEVDKFKRDLKKYNAGIILSLNSGIVGYSEMTEEIKDNKIIVYVPKADESCFSLYYSIIFTEIISRFELEQRKKNEYKAKSDQSGINPDILNNIIKALSPIKQAVKHYGGLITTLKRSGNKIIKEVNSMITEAQKVIESNQKVVQDTVDNIIEACQNRESPKDIQPYESATDLLIYKTREEEIKSEMGVFIIRFRTRDIILYEKSTSREIKIFQHTNTKKSELSALKRCKDAIAYIEKHKEYRPLRKRTKKNGQVEPLPPPSFIPSIILEKQKTKT